MSYKIIVVQIDEADTSQSRIELAAAITLAEDAHLIGVVVGTHQAASEDESSLPWAQRHGHAPAGEAAFERFERIALSSGITSFEKRLIYADPSIGFSQLGRHSDLLVLAQGDNTPGAGGLAADFVQYVVMNAGCPVLVVPGPHSRRGPSGQIENRILIGWNESAAAARAVRDAMPFLGRARELHVAVLDVGPAPLIEAPGAEIAVYLDRHGLPVEVHRRPAGEDAGHALLDLAHRLSCGLLVMGGVAHPHGRGTLLGGATRSALTSARIPVLMSH
jgi:nucleotide-binding universal stress UspA family protein